MYEDLDAAAARLADTNAGWVTRRDGADYLGNAAARALKLLHQYRDEPDVDVRRSVSEALSRSRAALEGVEPAAADSTGAPPSLEELVRACEKPGRREVKADGDDFLVKVTLKDRTQLVRISPVTRKDGLEIVRVSTKCGPPNSESLAWALRANAKLVQGALALGEEDGQEQIVLLSCFFASELTKKELHAAIKEIAYYGDWVESKLTGLDEF